MDMIPVTTEETMPSPVDPGEAAAEDEEVGDEADVEEDITSYAGRPQPLLTALGGTPSPSFSPVLTVVVSPPFGYYAYFSFERVSCHRRSATSIQSDHPMRRQRL